MLTALAIIALGTIVTLALLAPRRCECQCHRQAPTREYQPSINSGQIDSDAEIADLILTVATPDRRSRLFTGRVDAGTRPC